MMPTDQLLAQMGLTMSPEDELLTEARQEPLPELPLTEEERDAVDLFEWFHKLDT